MKKIIKNSFLQITLICFICVLLIIFYGTFRCNNPIFKDPLINGLTNNSNANKFLDGWGIAHLLFFFFLTFLYPSNFIYIFILGVIWEIIETIFKDRPFYILNCKAYDVLNTDPNYSPWWYGRWQDIIMNSIGIVSALIIKKFIL